MTYIEYYPDQIPDNAQENVLKVIEKRFFETDLIEKYQIELQQIIATDKAKIKSTNDSELKKALKAKNANREAAIASDYPLIGVEIDQTRYDYKIPEDEAYRDKERKCIGMAKINPATGEVLEGSVVSVGYTYSKNKEKRPIDGFLADDIETIEAIILAIDYIGLTPPSYDLRDDPLPYGVYKTIPPENPY